MDTTEDLPALAPAHYSEIPIEQIIANPDQPRTHFNPEALAGLAASVRAEGLIQPIVVKPDPEIEGRFQIVAGERRWRAAQEAGLSRLPAIVREMPPWRSHLHALVENQHRENLTPIEEALAYRALRETRGFSVSEIARRLGLERTSVNHRLRLLTLDPRVQELIDCGDLSAGHGKTLVGVPKQRQYPLAREAAKGRWTVRRLERLARANPAEETGPRKKARKSADLEHLENSIQERLGCPARLDWRGGRVSLQLRWYSLDEFDGFLERLGLSSRD